VDALPDLVDAAISMGKGDVKAALGHLADAAHKAPEVAAELVQQRGEEPPEGPAKALLSDKNFVQELFKDADTAKAIKQLATATWPRAPLAREGAQGREAAIDALAKDPSFKSAMDKLGLTADSLKKASDALPDLVEAGSPPTRATGRAPSATSRTPRRRRRGRRGRRDEGRQNLPAGPAKTLLTDRAFVDKLAASPNTAQAIKDLAAGDVVKGLKGLASDPRSPRPRWTRSTRIRPSRRRSTSSGSRLTR